MFLKDFIGKKVLSHEGKILGYTRSAFFSSGFKRITALLCSDEEEEDFILPLTQNQTVSDALIMPRRPSNKVTGTPYAPILKQVYSLQGEFLGCVSDVVMNDLVVASLIVNGKEYPVEKMKSFGDCILMNTTPKAPSKQKKRNPVEQKPRPTILLGKVLKYNIADENGKLLFAKGLIISQNTLKTAAVHKKLLELTAKTLAD